jgi:hypothetical protein
MRIEPTKFGRKADSRIFGCGDCLVSSAVSFLFLLRGFQISFQFIKDFEDLQ